jgi:hypothetical protein
LGEGGRRPGEGSVTDRAALLGGLRLLASALPHNPGLVNNVIPLRGIRDVQTSGKGEVLGEVPVLLASFAV